MIRLGRPSDRVIAACIASAEVPLSYSEVSATRTLGSTPTCALSARYDIDHHEFSLGHGRALFERARGALLAWRHFEIPWLELHGSTAPVEHNQVVATLVSFAGVWVLNACRVVCLEAAPHPADRVAFAYGSMRGHVVHGEERFEVSLDPNTEEVRYEIRVFSRPAQRPASLSAGDRVARNRVIRGGYRKTDS